MSENMGNGAPLCAEPLAAVLLLDVHLETPKDGSCCLSFCNITITWRLNHLGFTALGPVLRVRKQSWEEVQQCH